MPQLLPRSLSLCASLVLSAGSVRAQSIGYLRPDAYRLSMGDLKLFLYSGDLTGAEAPWPAAGIDWLFIRGGGNQENMHEQKPANPNDNFVTIRLQQPGVSLIGMDVKSPVKQLTPQEFDALAKSSNVPADKTALNLAAAGNTPVRVQQIDSSKLLVMVTSPDPAAQNVINAPSPVATSKAGQLAEFRLLMDPLHARVGGEIPFAIYIDGIKQPKAVVTITSSAGGQPQKLATDGSGTSHFLFAQPGRWMLEFRDLRPAGSAADADWIAHRAVFTFEAPGAAGQ